MQDICIMYDILFCVQQNFLPNISGTTEAICREQHVSASYNQHPNTSPVPVCPSLARSHLHKITSAFQQGSTPAFSDINQWYVAVCSRKVQPLTKLTYSLFGYVFFRYSIGHRDQHWLRKEAQFTLDRIGLCNIWIIWTVLSGKTTKHWSRNLLCLSV